MNKTRTTILAGFGLILAGFLGSEKANACTNFLFTKGATVDGSTMITYAADSHTLFGELYFRPAADYPEGTMMDVIEWDTGKKLGQIKQAKHTYSVIGNMNEHQVAIGETTYGGRKELLSQSTATVDYGSLIYIALQRAKTAREAIQVMTSLVAEYGYASEGESFSIADPNEVWILEMIGKGEGQKGAIWVARRIPEGYICGHANQARITTFPFNDPENCLYAKDIISFAREKGWFKGKDNDFSFSDTYNPVDFQGARFCEARVWSGFNKVNGDMKQYEKYALGNLKKGANGYVVNRLPLWIKPDHKLSVGDVTNIMRDHFEGTALDMTKDLGAGPYSLPYRWRPLTWKVDGKEYANERATSTQQTGFSFVAQCRSWMPDPIGGIFWFGVDDTYSTCYTPIYCGSTRTPECFAVGNGDMLTFNWNSAFWVFNTVANFSYLRYSDMIKDVQKVQHQLEQKHYDITPAVDETALTLWNNGKQNLALDYITDYSVNTANNMTTEWQKLAKYLIVKYKDGNIMKEKNGKFEQNEWGMPVSPNQPSAPDRWYRAIVKDTGDRLRTR